MGKNAKNHPFLIFYGPFRALEALLVVLCTLRVARTGGPPLDGPPIGRKGLPTARPGARRARRSSKKGDFLRFFNFCYILNNVKMCL